MGHPSGPVLSILKDALGIGDGVLEPCDVCHKAKQYRDPFPLSSHVSESLGDLIHLDVWGPYRTATHEGYKYFLTIVDRSHQSCLDFLT